MAQTAQGYCQIFILRGGQDLIGHGPEQSDPIKPAGFRQVLGRTVRLSKYILNSVYSLYNSPSNRGYKTMPNKSLMPVREDYYNVL